MDSAISGKVQRWALYLQQFDIHVKAISGVDNSMADWLSQSVEIQDNEADAEIDAISTPVACAQELPDEKKERQVFKQSPYLPTWEQWIEASRDIPKADKDYVTRHEDQLWYSKPGNKLYVPPCLREAILYYFHAGPYGGHFGISKTYRRLSRRFYWPKQKASITEYINCCLPCKRTGPPARRYLRQVLERSELFQLVSLDHVGLRVWIDKKVFYLVIIDYFSRFVTVKVMQGTTADETIRAFHEEWVIKFGAPEVVLADRDRVFVSRSFQLYVCGYLAADLVFTDAGYPQGNAINESVHKGLEASIVARKQYNATTDYEEVLGDTVLAYNSTPHSSIGQSPYYLLFRREMILTGLQRFREELPEMLRRARFREARKVAIMRAVMNKDEGLRLYKKDEFKVGDQVVYYLRPQERERIEREGEMPLVKYSPNWSVPTVITRVRDSIVDIAIAGGRTTTISKRLIRRVGMNVPLSLQALAEANIQYKPAKLRTRPNWAQEDTARKRVGVEEEEKK